VVTEKNFSHSVSELSRKANSERQQALVRVLFAVVVGGFFCATYFAGWFGGISVYVVYGVIINFLISTAILTSILVSPTTKVAARKIGMLVDLLFITVATSLGGSVGALGYGGYLWVTIANGLRYGVRYLKMAHISSLLCFSVVLIVSDYWQQNMVLGVGLWLWLLLLPIYVSKLLHILENAVHAANSANKAKSTFLANMSHEIRTPLTAIIGYAEVSLDSNQTLQERSHALKTIVRSGNHLLNIINDILDFSKVEADQLDVEFMSVELFQLVLDVESLMRPQAEKKGLEFNVLYDFPLPTKFGTDPVRIKQILLNLCSNAIKFTDQGSVSMIISCDCGNQAMQFAVKDTGIGMTAEQLQKLFKPFQQADSSITRRFGGTGLGLSLSKCLAEKLGGTIEVSSEAGKGTRFTLSTGTGGLHNAQFVHSIKQITYSNDTDLHTENEKALSGHILLAEDNPTNQQLLSLFLRKMGAEVSIAENGEVAVKLAQQNHYDLIYMDMQMPVLAGVDAIKVLREQGYDQPIVALTANATNEDKMTCIKAGCNDFITKPIPRQKLYDMTSNYLQPAEQARKSYEPIVSTLLSEEPSFRDLVEKFVAELPDMVNKLNDAYQQKDWMTLKDDLHSLKGMGGGFGYHVLTELAGKAEFQIFSENYDAAKTLLTEISQISELIERGLQVGGDNVVKLDSVSAI
jgi:signal transduction histidine kinase/DNA-binding NarL/FixJ family response regulator